MSFRILNISSYGELCRKRELAPMVLSCPGGFGRLECTAKASLLTDSDPQDPQLIPADLNMTMRPTTELQHGSWPSQYTGYQGSTGHVLTSTFPLVTESLLAPMCPTSYAERREAQHVLVAFPLWRGSPACLRCFELCALQAVPGLEVAVVLKTCLLPSTLCMHPKLHRCIQAEGSCFFPCYF